MTATLLVAVHLGMALGWATPAVYCSNILKPCHGNTEENCEAHGCSDCCSQGGSQNSLPDCCFIVSEKVHDGLLPSSVKVPVMTVSEWLTVTVGGPEITALSLDASTSSDAPDPPGRAGRSLLIHVSRLLV